MKKALFIGFLALSMGLSAQTVEKTYLFDFGGQGEQGTLTTVPGWNNIATENTGDKTIGKGTQYNNLVEANGNEATGIALTLTTAWGANGNSGGGGLLNPDSEQLGDLAVANATCDYIFNTNKEDDGRSFVISGLDTSKGYRLTIFGSRSSNDVRKGNYIFSGSNSWMTEMQVAGTGLGKNGENYRTGDAPVSDIIFPDAAGCITLYIENPNQTYVPISCMKMEQLSGVSKPALSGNVANTYYFDFGSEVANRGVATTEKGWNNILANSGYDCTAGTVFSNLVNSKGNPTSMSLTVDTKFTTNGYTTGLGLPSPSSDKLGDLAVETATYDYFFVDQANTSGKMTFKGLDQTKTKSYRFYLFASRKASDARLGVYRLEGLNSWSGVTQAAGNALDNKTSSQNESVILVSDPIFPESDGSIVLNFLNGSKVYFPINCMKIEELSGVERPNITTVVEAQLSSNGIAEGEKTTFANRGKNIFDLYVNAKGGNYTITGKDDTDATSTLEAYLADGLNRVNVNFNTNEVKVTAIKDFSIEGSTVGGWGPTCQEMNYVGSGVWNFKGELKGYDKSSDSGRIGFVINKGWNPTFKKVTGSAHDLIEDSGDDIPLNPGTYDITVDLNNMKFYIENGLDELDPYRITVMGSSVANGQGAEQIDGYNTGYAYQYDKHLAERFENGDSKYPFYISNISINGNSSVNLLDRFDDMEREFGKWVVYGISLGNEGIHEASDRQAVYDQWVTNMATLIDKARKQGKEVIVMNNYTRGDFVGEDYEYVKKINAEIARWDVPSINLLGAIDNGKGNWADGYQNGTDVYHPNTAGHTEFFYSMVPSLFDAMLEGKKLTMDRDTKASFEMPSKSTLEFTPDGTVHSFTFAISAKTADGDIIATIPVAGEETPLTITRSNGNIVALMPDNTSLSLPASSGLDEIVFSQNYIRKMVSLEVNGKTADEAEFTAISPKSVTIGNADAEKGMTVGEVMFYRSSMHDASPFTEDGKLNKSSLEVYVPMSETPANKAMSTVALTYTVDGVEQELPEEPTDDGNNKTDGVNSVEDNGSFRIYSNNAGTISVFSLNPTPVVVSNVQGQVIAKAVVEGSKDFSNLSKGLYIVNNKKIVVK